MNRHRTLIIVRGTVQGVGFRFSAVERARELGVTGYIRNDADGSVVAEVAGAEDAVAAFVAWAHHGPAAASVRTVEVLPRAEPEDDAAPDRPGHAEPLPPDRPEAGGGSGLAIIG